MKEYRIQTKCGNGKWLWAARYGLRNKIFATEEEATSAMYEYAARCGTEHGEHNDETLIVFRVVSRNVTEWKAV